MQDVQKKLQCLWYHHFQSSLGLMKLVRYIFKEADVEKHPILFEVESHISETSDFYWQAGPDADLRLLIGRTRNS